MADDGQVRIGIYVDNEGVKSSMDAATKTVKDGTREMSDAAKEAGKDIGESVSKGFDTAKLQQNFKQVESQIKSFAKTIAATATGFGVWIKQSAQSIDRIDKMSQRLGLSRKAFQELDYAASQTGLSVEQFAGSMRALVNNTQNGAESLKKLGVSIKTTTGELKSQEDLFFDVVNKLADMPPGIERTALGFELLGRNFQQLAPLINRGSAGIQELRDKFRDLGIEVSDKTIDDFVAFNDSLTDLGKTLKSSFNNALRGLIPQLKSVVTNITKMLEPGGKLNTLIEKLANVLYKFVSKILPPFLDALTWIIDNATLVAGGITAIAVAVKALTGNWVGAIASGLIGLFSTVAIASSDTSKGVDEVTESIKDLDKELSKQNNSGSIVKVTGTLEQMKEMLRLSEEELKLLQKQLTLLSFDKASMGALSFAAKQEQVKKKIEETTKTISAYKTAIKELEKAQAEAEALELQIDYFKDWGTAVTKAEQKLKKFVAAQATAMGGRFNLELLSEENKAEYDKLVKAVDEAAGAYDTLEEAVKRVNTEVEKTDPFKKWSDAVKEAEEDLKDFVALKAGDGQFDKALLSEEDRKQYDLLEAKLNNARKAYDSLNNTLKETTTEQKENITATVGEQDAFKSWSDNLANAEKALKQFIASRSDASGGFKVENLSPEDLAVYEQLKADVTNAKEALDSMNSALRDTPAALEDTNEELEKTDAFEKWTKAVQEAEEALKDFVAANAQDSGKFEVEALSEDQRKKFDDLKQTLQEARENLESLQKQIDDSKGGIESSLVDVADSIASAWGQVGIAMGNGIEAVVQSFVNGEQGLKEAVEGIADTFVDILSAMGDAIIQTGVAKIVEDSIKNSNFSGWTAIAMGMAIKAAAGTIKGLFAKFRTEGSYETGGIVGGHSYTGDKLLARVNSGEMILNRRQQQQLFALANGRGGGTGTSSNIQIINNAGDQVTAERSLDGRSIKIMVEKYASNMLRGIKGSKLMGQTYGIRQLGRH